MQGPAGSSRQGRQQEQAAVVGSNRGQQDTSGSSSRVLPGSNGAARCSSGWPLLPFPHLSRLEEPGARTHQQEERETNNDLK